LWKYTYTHTPGLRGIILIIDIWNTEIKGNYIFLSKKKNR
jgi:hypothetical protein